MDTLTAAQQAKRAAYLAQRQARAQADARRLLTPGAVRGCEVVMVTRRAGVTP